MANDFEEKIKDFAPNAQKRMRDMKDRMPDYDPFKSNMVPMSNKQLKEWDKTVEEADNMISKKK